MHKRILSIFTISLVISLFGCAKQEETASATYASSTTGVGGDISIEVTFKGDSIDNIEILKDNETAGVGEIALELMKEKVLSNQSVLVDTVSGATITSNAFLSAVKDTIKQANLENLFNKEITQEVTNETYDYDVVVVGSGISGLCAGLKAVESGANVAIIEKLGIVGGTSIFSSGIFLVADDDSKIDTVTNTYLSRNKIQDKNQVDKELVSSMLSIGPDLMKMIQDTGLTYEMKNEVYFYPDPSEKAIQNASDITLATAKQNKKVVSN